MNRIIRWPVFALLVFAAFVFAACTRSASTPLPEETPDPTAEYLRGMLLTKTAEAKFTETPTPSLTPEPTQEPTSTEIPTNTPTPEPTISDMSEEDEGWEEANEMLELGFIEPCSEEPLRVCPNRTISIHDNLKIMTRVLEAVGLVEIQTGNPVGIFDEGETANVSREDLLMFESLRAVIDDPYEVYLPVSLEQGDEKYHLSEFLCVASYLDGADKHLCLNLDVSKERLLALGALVVERPRALLEFRLPQCGRIFDDLPCNRNRPLARWAYAAVTRDEPLYDIEYRPELIFPDLPAERWEAYVLWYRVYQQLLSGGG